MHHKSYHAVQSYLVYQRDNSQAMCPIEITCSNIFRYQDMRKNAEADLIDLREKSSKMEEVSGHILIIVSCTNGIKESHISRMHRTI